jgi:hypothetical protein
MTVFNAETSNKYAEALKNKNCTVWFPENVKSVAATKGATKDVNSHIIWCTCAKRENKTRMVERKCW